MTAAGASLASPPTHKSDALSHTPAGVFNEPAVLILNRTF